MRLAIVIVAATVFAAGPASAAPEAEARVHFQVAQGLYKLGDFRGAIKEFTAGYQLTHKAGFLLNLAQSYRQLHELTRARDFYRQFLSEAGADDVSRPAATQLLSEVEAELRAHPVVEAVAQPSPAPAPALVVAVARPAPVPPPRRKRALRIAGIVLSVVGVGLAGGGGVGAAVVADGEARDLNNLDHSGGTFDAAKDDRYHLDRALEGGFFGAGAALAATGVILLAVSAR